MFRVFPSNRASPGGHASTTKKEIKTVKKSVCPAIVLDTFCFLLKRRLREISTYYFVFFFFFKCVFLLLLFIKSALFFFLNSRVCFCLTEQTQRESVWNSERKSKLDHYSHRYPIWSQFTFVAPKQRCPIICSLQTRQMFSSLFALYCYRLNFN